MPRIRVVACALAVLTLAACGAQPFPTADQLPPSGNSAAVGVTVHLGTDPRLAPVERLLSASKSPFNAGLFVSAFDTSTQPCDVVTIAQGVEGHDSQPPLDVAKARVITVTSKGNNGAVELTDGHPYYLRLRHANGEWVVNENACLWISEVDGAQLPAGITTGMAPLNAGDPRRAPAAALIDSLTQTFQPALFTSAFDVAEQACDVPGLARQVGAVPTGKPKDFVPRYFVRPLGVQQVAVVVQGGGGVIALRVHQVDGHWFLNEDACIWLVEFLTSKVSGGADSAVQSDLRNALTAEKTIYTDQEMYSASVADMKAIEPSLDWGNRLQIHVGDALTPGDRNVVCLTESSASGKTFSIADVAAGPKAGTYYSEKPCPVPLTPSSVATHDSSGSSGTGA